jgi:hypothetical protein
VQQAAANNYSFSNAGLVTLREDLLWKVSQLRNDLSLSVIECHEAQKALRRDYKTNCVEEWKAITAQACTDQSLSFPRKTLLGNS